MTSNFPHEKAMGKTAESFSFQQLFFSTSHSRTVLSSPPDTMRLAEGESDLAPPWGKHTKKLWKMAIEKVDLPIKHGWIFPVRYVKLSEGK